MRVVLSRTGHFVGRLSLQIVPSVTASVIGGYLLAQLVPQHAATPAVQPAPVALKTDTAPAVANDHAPIRVIPLPPRDGQAAESPAEVRRPEARRPDPKPAEVRKADIKPADAKSADAKAADVKQADAKPADLSKPPETKKAVTTPSATPADLADAKAAPRAKEDIGASAQPYSPEPYTPEADMPQVASQPVLQSVPQAYATPKLTPPLAAPTAVASAPALPAPTTVGPAAPTLLSPVTVSSPRPVERAPEHREIVVSAPPREREKGTAGQVFSTISGAAGTAANVTGNTINWVFGLPGKLIGREDQRDDDERDGRQQAAEPRRLM